MWTSQQSDMFNYLETHVDYAVTYNRPVNIQVLHRYSYTYVQGFKHPSVPFSVFKKPIHVATPAVTSSNNSRVISFDLKLG